MRLLTLAPALIAIPISAQIATVTEGTVGGILVGFSTGDPPNFLLTDPSTDATQGSTTLTQTEQLVEPLGGFYTGSIETAADFSTPNWSGTLSASQTQPAIRDASTPGFNRFSTSSIARVDFSIAQAGELLFDYSGSSAATGDPGLSFVSSFAFTVARVDLSASGSSVIVFQEEIGIDQPSTSFGNPGGRVDLRPGEYFVRWVAVAGAGNGQGFDQESVSAQFSATVIPAPGAAPVLCLAAVAATRRRR